jgi:hypothetical protein
MQKALNARNRSARIVLAKLAAKGHNEGFLSQVIFAKSAVENNVNYFAEDDVRTR